MGGVLLATAMGVLLALAVFLVIRWFWLWYWRVNELVDAVQFMAATLQRIEEQGRPLPPGVVPPPGSPWARPDDWLPRAPAPTARG